jgi:hypothetical protein
VILTAPPNQIARGAKIPLYLKEKLVFTGLDALNAAKDSYGQRDKASYRTPNIAFSGNRIVIAWANGVFK